jgi:hypothetical protein
MISVRALADLAVPRFVATRATMKAVIRYVWEHPSNVGHRLACYSGPTHWDAWCPSPILGSAPMSLPVPQWRRPPGDIAR